MNTKLIVLHRGTCSVNPRETRELCKSHFMDLAVAEICKRGTIG